MVYVKRRAPSGSASFFSEELRACNMAPPTLTSFSRNETYNKCCIHVHAWVKVTWLRYACFTNTVASSTFTLAPFFHTHVLRLIPIQHSNTTTETKN